MELFDIKKTFAPIVVKDKINNYRIEVSVVFKEKDGCLSILFLKKFNKNGAEIVTTKLGRLKPNIASELSVLLSDALSYIRKNT